jgi:hypothetical protein
MKMEAPNDRPLERKKRKGLDRNPVINGVIHGRTGFIITTTTVPSNSARKLVGTSNIVTRFTTALESCWYTT